MDRAIAFVLCALIALACAVDAKKQSDLETITSKASIQDASISAVR